MLIGISAVSFSGEAAGPDASMPFGVGERLRFEISYLGIKGGEAELEVLEIVPIGERKAFHIRATVRSTGWVSKLYRVNDTFDTYVDTEHMRPLLMQKDIDERSYLRRKTVVFDHQRGTAQYTSEKERRKTGTSESYSKEFPLNPGAQDELSALYYLRFRRLGVGDLIRVRTFSGKENYDLNVAVSEGEKVKTGAGTFDAALYTPILHFKTRVMDDEKSNKLDILMTKDARRWPVLIKAKTFIGHLEAELVEAREGKFLEKITGGDAAATEQPNTP